MATLEDLLIGANEPTYIEIEGFDDKFEVRKLNVKEERKYKRIINKSLGKVSTTERNGFRNKGQEANAEIDIAETNDAEYEANMFLIVTSFNVDGATYKEKEIEELLSGEIFNKLVDALKELNNLDNSRDTEEEVKK